MIDFPANTHIYSYRMMPVPKQKSALYACKTELKTADLKETQNLHPVSGMGLVEESWVIGNLT